MHRRARIEEPHTHRQTLELHGESVREIHWIEEPYTMKANAVCADCNGGWMSRLEQRAESATEPLLAGRGRVLHREGQRVLATWALKTALMFDQASPADSRIMPSAYYRHLFDHGAPPAGVWVWATSYGGEMPGFACSAAAEVTAAGEADPDERNLFMRTFSMGRIVFQVLGTTNTTLAASPPRWVQPNIHQIWPYLGSITWAAEPSLTDEGIGWFGTKLLNDLVRVSRVYEP